MMAARKRTQPNPESEWYSTAQDKRARPKVGVTLSPDAVDALSRLSKQRGESKSVVVESLILAAAKRLRA